MTPQCGPARNATGSCWRSVACRCGTPMRSQTGAASALQSRGSRRPACWRRWAARGLRASLAAALGCHAACMRKGSAADGRAGGMGVAHAQPHAPQQHGPHAQPRPPPVAPAVPQPEGCHVAGRGRGPHPAAGPGAGARAHPAHRKCSARRRLARGAPGQDSVCLTVAAWAQRANEYAHPRGCCAHASSAQQGAQRRRGTCRHAPSMRPPGRPPHGGAHGHMGAVGRHLVAAAL